MIRIWPAEIDDLQGIMEVEKECFGAISEDAMASSEIMKQRIILCNKGNYKWFWAAGHKRIVGYIILQPTSLVPEQCDSWNHATDHGCLKSTFNEEGESVYIVSLAVHPKAPRGSSELLVHAALVEWASSNKPFLMFCSRIPGFRSAHEHSGISVEAYWKLKRRNGSPKDPMLRLYWEMAGKVEPYRLLKNGFEPDPTSCGHGVLFVVVDAARALRATASMIYRAGLKTLK